MGALMPAASLMPICCRSLAAISNGMKGSERKCSGPFLYTSRSQAVTGRLACLTVVPALVIFSVTPPPE